MRHKSKIIGILIGLSLPIFAYAQSANYWYPAANKLRPIVNTYALQILSTTATSTFFGGFIAGNNGAFTVNQLAGANSLFVAGNGNVGIGTSSPSNKLEVNGNGYFNGNLTAPYFTATSTTATSTFTGGISVGSNLTYNSSTHVLANVGEISFGSGGAITMDSPNGESWNVNATQGSSNAIGLLNHGVQKGFFGATNQGFKVEDDQGIGIVFQTSGTIADTNGTTYNDGLGNMAVNNALLVNNGVFGSPNQFAVYDDNSENEFNVNSLNDEVSTLNNTLDDGSGNLTTLGNITDTGVTSCSNGITTNSSGTFTCNGTAFGVNYFSNSSATTTLSTGTKLAATLGVFGSVQATSTTATSTFAGPVSVGSSTPIGEFVVSKVSTPTTTPFFTVASTTGATSTNIFQIDGNGHIVINAGNAPTISCSPSGGSVVGDDVHGTITTGTLSTSCTVTFARPYTSTPYFVGLTTNSGTVTAGATSLSTTAFTVGLSVGLTGKVYYLLAQ